MHKKCIAMDLLHASLRMPPSINNLYEVATNGAWHLTKNAAAWFEESVYRIRDVRTTKNYEAITQASRNCTPLKLTIVLFLSESHLLEHDEDNIVKITQDAIIAALYPSHPDYDDSFIFKLDVSKRPLTAKQTAFVTVRLETMEEDEELCRALQRISSRRQQRREARAIRQSTRAVSKTA